MTNHDLYPIGAFIKILKDGSFNGHRYHRDQIYEILRGSGEAEDIVRAQDSEGRIIKVSMCSKIKGYGKEAELLTENTNLYPIY